MISTVQPLSIGNLPTELDLTIRSYLNAEDLGRSGVVNKHWNILAKDPTLWAKLFPEFVEEATFEGLDVKKYMEKFHIIPLPSLDKVTNHIQRFANGFSINEVREFKVLSRSSQKPLISAKFGRLVDNNIYSVGVESEKIPATLTETYLLIDPFVKPDPLIRPPYSGYDTKVFPRSFHKALFLVFRSEPTMIEKELLDIIQTSLANRIDTVAYPIFTSIRKTLESIRPSTRLRFNTQNPS